MKTMTTLTAIQPSWRVFLWLGAGHNGITFVEQHAKVANDRKLSILYQYVRQRRAELQICEHGGLRKGREASEPELFADPNKSTTGAK